MGKFRQSEWLQNGEVESLLPLILIVVRVGVFLTKKGNFAALLIILFNYNTFLFRCLTLNVTNRCLRPFSTFHVSIGGLCGHIGTIRGLCGRLQNYRGQSVIYPYRNAPVYIIRCNMSHIIGNLGILFLRVWS